MPLARVSWPRPLGGTSRPYGTWLCTPAPSSSIVWIVEMLLASGISYRSARIIGKEGRTFRADQDCHSIVTTPWRTAKTSACSLEETSSLERMLVTWE